MPPSIDRTAAVAMTDDEVCAVLDDAQKSAQEVVDALAAAEADPASVTAARLAELRQEAEHAALVVDDAVRRQSEIRDIRAAAYRAELADRIAADAPADLDHADELLTRLQELDDAMRAFATAAADHNDRITHWRREMRSAKLHAGPDPDTVTIDSRTRRQLDVPRIVQSLTYRAMNARFPAAYPLIDDPYGHRITGERPPSGHRRSERIDLADIIRKDT